MMSDTEDDLPLAQIAGSQFQKATQDYPNDLPIEQIASGSKPQKAFQFETDKSFDDSDRDSDWTERKKRNLKKMNIKK